MLPLPCLEQPLPLGSHPFWHPTAPLTPPITPRTIPSLLSPASSGASLQQVTGWLLAHCCRLLARPVQCTLRRCQVLWQVCEACSGCRHRVVSEHHRRAGTRAGGPLTAEDWAGQCALGRAGQGTGQAAGGTAMSTFMPQPVAPACGASSSRPAQARLCHLAGDLPRPFGQQGGFGACSLLPLHHLPARVD